MTTEQNQDNHERIRQAVDYLSQSEAGRSTLGTLYRWLDKEDGLRLDAAKKQATLELLQLAWGSYPGTVRDVIWETIQP